VTVFFFFLDSPVTAGGDRRATAMGAAVVFDLAAAKFCQKGLAN